jgi:hypothetical protein
VNAGLARACGGQQLQLPCALHGRGSVTDIERSLAASIDIAVLSHTIGGVEGIPDPTVAMSTARWVNDFLAAEVAGSGGRFADSGRTTCISTRTGDPRTAHRLRRDVCYGDAAALFGLPG